jgi:hypothetical protein
VAFLLRTSIAVFAKLPPVPLSTATAKLAVSPNTPVIVAFPDIKELAVSVMLIVLGCHRGSNQSAWKSKKDDMRIIKRTEQ